MSIEDCYATEPNVPHCVTCFFESVSKHEVRKPITAFSLRRHIRCKDLFHQTPMVTQSVKSAMLGRMKPDVSFRITEMVHDIMSSLKEVLFS
jgi:hypothetical protein